MKKISILSLLAAALVAASLLAGCATVTIRPEGGDKVSTTPDYKKSKPYFFWGLSKAHFVDVQKVCEGKGAEQIQSQYTFVDGLLGALTIGIYAPKTAKVWCKEGAAQ